MEQSNGTPTKKKQVFFSIGSYSERDKRVINKISTNSLFSEVTLRNEQPPREPPPRRVLRERPASLDATDSVKHSHTLPNLRKFKPLESLVDEDDRVIIVDKNGDVEKPSCPPTSSGDNVCAKPSQQPNGQVEKPAYPPKMINRSVSLDTDQLRHTTGKVALTIAAYEGEPRTPTRLDFLPSQKLSRSSSKASDVSSSLTTTPLEEEATEHIGSRLQNELVATLKRSNLKKRHDEDGETPPSSPAVSKRVDFEFQDNERVEEVEIHVEQSKEEAELPTGSVKKVATVLEKSLTFRANPEATAPTDLPQEIVEKKEQEVEDKKITQKEELDLKEVTEAPAEKEVHEVEAHEAPAEKEALQVQAHEVPEKEVLEVEAHEALEKEVLEVEAHEAPAEKEVHEVEAHEAPAEKEILKAHETPEKVVEAEAHETSSATELPKEEKQEEHKASEKDHEAVLQVGEAKVPEKESKLPENSIEKSLVEAFDEIITLTDDTENKK